MSTHDESDDHAGSYSGGQLVPLTRVVRVPNPVKLARFRKVPELGPCVLFFSGGTALNPLSRRLTDYTHNSIHLVTPFDSGGSSAKLRDAFRMPSVGDMRSRLMALANHTVTGHPEIYDLFVYRFPKDADSSDLRQRLAELVDGDSPLVAAIPDPMRKLIRNHLRFFLKEMPADFDLRGASIGNLILAGGYLNNERHIDPVVFMFSKLVEVLGTVRTVVNADLHLVAELADGRRVIGQREITGKEVAPLNQRIERLYLTDAEASGEPAHVSIRQRSRDLIARAELICYPIGSFFSSVVANLLPGGVAESIAANPCPKIYVPNMGPDPEQYGLSVADCVRRLIEVLGSPDDVHRVLRFVVVDSRRGDYPAGLSLTELTQLGVGVIDVDLVDPDCEGHIDSDKLIGVLLSLA